MADYTDNVLSLQDHRMRRARVADAEVIRTGAKSEFKFILGLALIRVLKHKGYQDRDIANIVLQLSDLYSEIITSIHNEETKNSF